MSEEEKWKMEAKLRSRYQFQDLLAKAAFIDGYLQACKVRGEEFNKEIERLKTSHFVFHRPIHRRAK